MPFVACCSYLGSNLPARNEKYLNIILTFCELVLKFFVTFCQIAQAFMDIVGGEVPKDRIALKVLADEMENWPFLDSDGRS